MKHLKLFEEYGINRESIINKIIDSEVIKSKNFGLDIEQEDIELEKKLLNDAFSIIWDDLENCKSSSEYQDLQNFIYSGLENKFRYEHYKDICSTKDVKNMYPVHISSVISTIFMTINNKLY